MAVETVQEKAAPENGGVMVVQQPGSDTTSDAAVNDGSTIIVSKRLKPSTSWTKHQLFYVFVLDGIGGMALSAATNFALAYPMYTVPDTVKNPVKLFALPNTLAGDGAVTIFVQCVLTWFVELGLLRFDMRNKWWFLLPSLESPSKKPSTTPLLSPRTKSLKEIPLQAVRGLIIAVASFLVLWPISVGALTAVGTKQEGDWVFDDRLAPQAFKAVLGGVIGLFTTPLMAFFWLVRAGWEAEGRGDQEEEEV